MASDTYRSDPKRAAELACRLAQYLHLLSNPLPAHHIADVTVAMQRAARGAKRWGETCCNMAMDEAQQARGDKRQSVTQAKINARLDELASSAGLNAPTIELGGDPRGPCATLHIPGQRGDGWGDGFAVY